MTKRGSISRSPIKIVQWVCNWNTFYEQNIWKNDNIFCLMHGGKIQIIKIILQRKVTERSHIYGRLVCNWGSSECSLYLEHNSRPLRFLIASSRRLLQYWNLILGRGYDSFSDVPESRVSFASKNLTLCRMHWNAFLIAQIIAKCHSFPNMYGML